MAHADYAVTINRTAAEVYAFLADGLNNPKWRKGVTAIALARGVTGSTGAVYSQQMRGPGGRSIDGDYEVTLATPVSELAFQVIAGPARPTGRYTLASDGAGCRVTFSLDFAPRGALRLMNRMIAKTMESEVRQLDNLKVLLESG